MLDFTSSLWNQRKYLVDPKKRLLKLQEAVNRPIAFAFPEWIQLYSLVLEFSPDLIIELGRGRGNSTCLFTEAVNKSGKGKVVSIGYDSEHAWETITVPSLQKLISPQWLDKLRVIQQDIIKTDFTEITRKAQRILLFWDAHGKELAQYVLAYLFPLLQNKEHLIVVHDITDTGHSIIAPSTENDAPKLFWIQNLASPFEEIIPLFDFISSNGILYDTMRESVRRFLRENEQTSPDRSKELKSIWNELVGDSETLGERSHMIYFDINNKTNKI